MSQMEPLTSEQGLKFRIAVITAVGTVIVAVVGALGPLQVFLHSRAAERLESERQRHELALADAKRQHEVDMDFLAKLIDSERIINDEQKSFYRRDVLQFFDATLPPGPLKSLARDVLKETKEELKKFQDLKDLIASKEKALAEVQSGDREAIDKLTAEINLYRSRANSNKTVTASRGCSGARWDAFRSCYGSCPADGLGIARSDCLNECYKSRCEEQ
jgi:hypothetical protein